MKNTRKNALLVGSIITLLILSTPYLLYFHNSIPYEAENVEFWIFTIKGGLYSSAQIYVFFLFSKLVPLLLLIIWFLTNKHWWVHAILVPISVYLFQLISVVNDSEDFIDTVEFIYTVPLIVLIALILYFVRSKMAIYIIAVDLKKEMDDVMQNPKKIE